MKRPVKPRFAAIAFATLSTAALAPALAHGDGHDDGDERDDPRVYPINSSPFGSPYSVWSAQFWPFILSIPPASNPILDSTGDLCPVGQRGPVWIFPGTFGGTAKRNGTIPTTKAMFFPIFDNFEIDTPGLCGQTASVSIAELRALAADSVDRVKQVSVEIDGQPVRYLLERFRVRSAVYSVSVPPDNLFSPCLPAGAYSPGVDDGYYLMVKRLPPGGHTLRIHAVKSNSPDPDFQLDVTYYLNVVPVTLR